MHIKLHAANKRKPMGFTLIEMIGVLAVIAILAALLIPKVFNAINDARINTAIVGAQTVKTAVIDSYAKNGRFDATNNVVISSWSVPWYGYDTNVLMAQGLLDKPFNSTAGTNCYVQVLACAGPSQKVAGDSKGAYALQGNASVNDVTGAYVVEAVIQGVAEADAQAISQRIDGPSMSQNTAALGVSDNQGRVKYDASGTPGGPVEVHIYLAHR